MNTKTEHIQKYPIFLWDLHDVVFQKSWWRWFKIFFFFNKKWSLISHLSFSTIKLAVAHLLEKIGLKKYPLTAEELIIDAKKHNNQALIELILKICCAYKPIDQTIQIIEKLHAQGYTQHIGSNIGNSIYQEFIHLYPHIFALFKKAQVVKKRNDHDEIIKKPKPAYYQYHLDTYNLKPNQIIFIDDKKKNIIAAQKLGITAIQYKNPVQLKNALIKLGFNL